jgi:YesN/AraC family two-component response regulator
MPIKIILADDHAIIRQGLEPLFGAEQGMELLAQAGNGREAWGLIESLRPDVAILDISMPEMTGIEVTRRVVDAGFNTQVILLRSGAKITSRG